MQIFAVFLIIVVLKKIMQTINIILYAKCYKYIKKQ